MLVQPNVFLCASPAMQADDSCPPPPWARVGEAVACPLRCPPPLGICSVVWRCLASYLSRWLGHLCTPFVSAPPTWMLLFIAFNNPGSIYCLGWPDGGISMGPTRCRQGRRRAASRKAARGGNVTHGTPRCEEGGLRTLSSVTGGGEGRGNRSAL